MKVRSSGVAGGADERQGLAGGEGFAGDDEDYREVAVAGGEAASVVDRDADAAGAFSAGFLHGAGGGRADGRAHGGGDVDAGVESPVPVDGVDPVAEAAHDGSVD